MTKENERDPWEINPEEARRYKDSVKAKSVGIPCPRMNPSIKQRCFVCEKLMPLWKFPKGSKEREVASNKKANLSYFFNAVLPHDPNKALVVEVGKKAGDTIIANMTDGALGWKNVANPLTGKGFFIKISKRSESGYNAYPVNKGDTADFDIPKDMLNNLTNLSNSSILKMLADGEFSDSNYMHINSIKMDETLTLRILPAWNWKTDGNRQPISHIYRHWGNVTEAEVTGESQIDLSIDSDETTDDDKPIDDIFKKSTQDVTVDKEDIPETVTSEKNDEIGTTRPCFGKWYEEGEDDCVKCVLAKKCSKSM